jgi:hypothetical protein
MRPRIPHPRPAVNPVGGELAVEQALDQVAGE